MVSTPAHLFFTESFFPKLVLLFLQLPEILDCRLAGPHLILKVLYCLVFAPLQHFHRVILNLHCDQSRALKGEEGGDGSRRFNRSAEIGEEAAGGSGGM